MRQTAVPAQVTDVEDRITSTLGLNQLLLLVTPVFTGSILFFLVPPFGRAALYKVVCIALSFFVCVLLAIRVQGKLVLFWLAILLRYNIRPRFYVFDKHTMSGREENGAVQVIEDNSKQETRVRKVRELHPLPTTRIVELERIMNSPETNLQFEANRQGGLYVRITEVK